MRLRRVLVAVAILAVATVGLDRVVPARRGRPAGAIPSVPAGGVLACPIATTGEGDATLYLFNAGVEPGRARILVRPVDGTGVRQLRVGLVSGGFERIELQRLAEERAAVVIEWSGGKIIASHTLITPPRLIAPGRRLPRFAAGSMCREPSGPDLALAAARTTAFGDTTLSLLNPGPAAADVSISVRVDGRFEEPQRLQRRIIRPLSRRDFSLGQFAFGKGEIAVVIRATSGRVVAEALIENREGAELIAAGPPLASGIVLAGTSGGETRLSLSATEEVPLALDAVRYADGETPAGEVPSTLGPGITGQVLVPSLGDGDPIGYALETVTGGRLTAAVSWPLSGSVGFDLAAVSAAVPSAVWRLVAPVFDANWRLDVLVAPAGGEEAIVELETFGSEARTASLDLAPGTVRQIRLAQQPGAHGAIFRADVPIVVVVLMTTISGSSGGAFIAEPERIALQTAPSSDDSVGISAP